MHLPIFIFLWIRLVSARFVLKLKFFQEKSYSTLLPRSLNLHIIQFHSLRLYVFANAAANFDFTDQHDRR